MWWMLTKGKKGNKQMEDNIHQYPPSTTIQLFPFHQWKDLGSLDRRAVNLASEGL